MTNQNQPSEVKEGGALEKAVQHIRDLLAFSEQMIAEITAERRKNAEHLRAVLDALAARPPSMERGEAEGGIKVAAKALLDEVVQDPLGRWFIDGDAEILVGNLFDAVELAAAPSPAPSAWNAVAEAFRKGAMAALGCEPWDDADDFFSLVGMDYAQGKPFPPTMPKPRPAPSAVEMAGVDRDLIDAAQCVVDCWGVGRLNLEAFNEFMDELRRLLALATASREKGTGE